MLLMPTKLREMNGIARLVSKNGLKTISQPISVRLSKTKFKLFLIKLTLLLMTQQLTLMMRSKESSMKTKQIQLANDSPALRTQELCSSMISLQQE